ncbi:hypothetical protein BKA56DRAFT_485344 [Ilyonectria sp. MPI-CAGE-AT-0026]|nr:hypothetical protein BKA56DRAFT_485344 [Ilyonectria sp. MPI-CAGE-AT-0026]
MRARRSSRSRTTKAADPIDTFPTPETKTKKRSTYDRNFDLHLTGHRAHTPYSSQDPGSADVRNALAVYRPSFPASSDVTGSSSEPSTKTGVEGPDYQCRNLAANNIYMRSSRDQLPDHVTDLIDQMRRDRDSPGPTLDQVWEDKGLEKLAMGANKSVVRKYFQETIFPDPDPGDSLQCSDGEPMAEHAVPNTSSILKVSIPVPDMLYGYDEQEAFPQQQTQLVSMGTEMIGNNQNYHIIYPFLVIEVKGDGESMWGAMNQCLGGSASCVNVAENLNRRLRPYESDMVHPIDSAAFSIAMNGAEARLYLTWKDNEQDYYMTTVDRFLLQDPEHYLKFRKYVLNIIDWGRGRRLEEIRKSLDNLLEESRKRNSAAAKSRALSDSASSCSSSSSGKTRKKPSKRQKSRGSDMT